MSTTSKRGRPVGATTLNLVSWGDLKGVLKDFPDESLLPIGAQWSKNYPALPVKAGTASQVAQRVEALSGDAIEVRSGASS